MSIFSADDLYDLASGIKPGPWDYTERPEPTYHLRWSVDYGCTVTNGTDFYRIVWSCGATEAQDTGPEHFEYWQVWPKQVVQTIYTKEKPE